MPPTALVDRHSEPFRLDCRFRNRDEVSTLADWSLSLGGILLIAIGGVGSARVADINPFGSGWLIWGLGLV